MSLLPIVLPAQASDPSTFELIQKIHTLQKHLISKTEEVVEKELLLQVAFLFSVVTEQPGFASTVVCRSMLLELLGSTAGPKGGCRWQQ